MVVQGMGPGNQLSKPPEQLLQAEVCSESFVERVFVKDHAGRFLGAVGWAWRRRLENANRQVLLCIEEHHSPNRVATCSAIL